MQASAAGCYLSAPDLIAQPRGDPRRVDCPCKEQCGRDLDVCGKAKVIASVSIDARLVLLCSASTVC